MNSKVTYRQQFTRCGKQRCHKCKDGAGHGPYWYAYWSENGRTISKYIGIHPPAGIALTPGKAELQHMPSNEGKTEEILSSTGVSHINNHALTTGTSILPVNGQAEVQGKHLMYPHTYVCICLVNFALSAGTIMIGRRLLTASGSVAVLVHCLVACSVARRAGWGESR
jgi:hypothetical protein